MLIKVTLGITLVVERRANFAFDNVADAVRLMQNQLVFFDFLLTSKKEMRGIEYMNYEGGSG